MLFHGLIATATKAIYKASKRMTNLKHLLKKNICKTKHVKHV